jgi:hypothetical protein
MANSYGDVFVLLSVFKEEESLSEMAFNARHIMAINPLKDGAEVLLSSGKVFQVRQAMSTILDLLLDPEADGRFEVVIPDPEE